MKMTFHISSLRKKLAYK